MVVLHLLDLAQVIAEWVEALRAHLIAVVVEGLEASECAAEEVNGQDYEEVPNGDAQDLSPDGGGQDRGVGGRNGLQDLLQWWLGGESDSSERVHDEVHPQELDCVQGTLTEESDTRDDEQQHRNIDSELELEELAHIVVDVPAPHDGPDGRLEVVLGQDQVTGALRRGAARSHGKTDVSLLQSGDIVDALASGGHCLLAVLQSNHEFELVVRVGTREDFHILKDELLEAVLLVESVRGCAISILLVLIDLLVIELADLATEIVCVHDAVSILH